MTSRYQHPEALRLQVIAELSTGASYESVALKHNINRDTGRRWLAEAGVTKQRAPYCSGLTELQRKAIERRLRDGWALHRISADQHVGTDKIRAVRDEMQARQEQKETA